MMGACDEGSSPKGYAHYTKCRSNKLISTLVIQDNYFIEQHSLFQSTYINVLLIFFLSFRSLFKFLLF